MKKIEIVPRSDKRLWPFMEAMFESKFAISFVVLFGGDRWSLVERVALALSDEGQIVGMATLAPTDEEGKGGPNIIGCWVALMYRRQGLGSALVEALVKVSYSRYGHFPTVEGSTDEGLALAKSLVKRGIQVQVRGIGAAHLP